VRDLLIAGILLGALPFALRYTWVGVLLWNWVSLMNPHKLAYGFVFDAPVAAIAGGAALLSLVIGKDKLRMPSDPPVIVLAIFVLWMCITTLLAIDPAGSVDQLNKVLKIQLMVFVAFAAIQTRKHIELFIWVCVLSIGFYGVKGGVFTLLTGGGARVWGPPGGFIEDNNSLAVALVITIPFVNYLRMVSSRVSFRYSLLGLTLLCAVAALGTQSRGALLALSAMAGLLWVRSRKKAMVGATLAAVAISLLAFMPASWEARMSTIQTYESDGSAMSRLDSWTMCFNLANDRPIGGGFGVYTPENYAKYNPNSWVTAGHGSTVAHSIYFSVLAEHGWVGLFIYLTLGVLSYRLASRIRRDTKNLPQAAWAHHLAGMCQVSLVGFAVGGSFLSLAYFDLPYNIIVILVATRRWLNDRGWEKEPNGPFGSANPVGDKALAVSRQPQVAK
jgi:probable O-glycosylation ligase (exosortase A-associated)